MNRNYVYTATDPRPAFGGRLATVDPVCLDILWHRGFRTQQEMEQILFPSIDDVLNHELLKDMDKAIAVLSNALKTHQHIVVYQDYDADGCCSCAIAVECLRNLGGKVSYYCNDRSVDGFGFCVNGVDNILSTYPDAKVILTVDNGVVACEATEYANSKGMTVVITDHHEPGEVLPNAAAVVDAKRKDETYPYHDLCGAGVSFKLMVALYRALGHDIAPVVNTLDIAALATVADVVPLLGENRAIVHEGLELIRQNKRPAFAALNRIMEPKSINAQHTLAFIYGPMVNSLNRMGEDPTMAVDLMLCQNDDKAGEIVLELRALNEERKELTDAQKDIVDNMVDPKNVPPVIVVYSNEFTEGLVGIIAGRVKEKYNRPAIVFADSGEDELKGSARSTGEVNIKEALDQVAELTTAYGGHAKAAGVSIKKADFERFKKAITDIVLPAVKGSLETTELDASITASDISTDMIAELSILEPYGEGFPAPVFELQANPEFDRFMGTESQHIKFKDAEHSLDIIRWNGAEAWNANPVVPDKFVGKLSLNEWRGRVTPQFICED